MNALFPAPSLIHLSNPLRRWTHCLGRNWARLSYGYHVEPTWLEVNRHNIPIADLPAEFDGFRIVQLSDLHCSGQMPSHFLDEAIELAQEQEADLAVVTGDFVHKGYKHIETATAAVARLSVPHGVHAVLGNHDFAVRNALGIRHYRGLHQRIADALSERGVQVLRNRNLKLERGGASIFLCGVDDLWSRACDLAGAFDGIPADAPRILLAHNPRTIEQLDDRRCDLMLSGHTHGGQINWPGYGPLFLGRKTRRFASGLFRLDNTHLYVNKGVGFGLPFRFRVRPEVAVLTLRRAS